MSRRSGSRSRSPREIRAEAREWLGGRFLARAHTTVRGQHSEDDEIEAVLWLELPSYLVVGLALLESPEPGTLARTLTGAMERPLAGDPRRPDRIRVATAQLAEELRGVIDPGTPVTVAPTPELEAMFESMVEAVQVEGDEESQWTYVEEQGLAPAALGELFAAAADLYRRAPWRGVNDHDLLRFDIPRLGIEGACVSIMGLLGESLGFLVFPSRDAFARFAEAAAVLESSEDAWESSEDALDFGTRWLALTFDHRRDVSRDLLREAKAHGFTIAAARAFPIAESHDRDGALEPLLPSDLELITACTRGLVQFYDEHRSAFRGDGPMMGRGAYDVPITGEVSVRCPYEDDPLRALLESSPVARHVEDRDAAAFAHVGRNDPCPCGSGRKFKKCHLPILRSAQSAKTKESVHERDARLVSVLAGYAQETFGDRWFTYPKIGSATLEQTLPFVAPWSVYGHHVAGKPVAQHYVDRYGSRLEDDDRAWIEAQLASWVSVWEVVEVEPGEGVTVRDLLGGDTLRVHELLASRSLVVRDAVLARVVHFDGVAVFCGMFPVFLPPLPTADLVRRARGRLRLRGPVPHERLRDPDFGAYLVRRWVEAVELRERSSGKPRALQNADGDPFLLTTDRFDLRPGSRPEVVAALARLPGLDVERPAPEEDSAVFLYLRANERTAGFGNTIVGRAVVDEKRVLLETNSIPRADALRARVEQACGKHLRFRLREHADPLSERALPEAPEDELDESEDPELRQLALDFKARHYEHWADEPLPALGGLTPRAAVRTKTGRDTVDALLKDMENTDQRFDPLAAFDFSSIRRELGLE